MQLLTEMESKKLKKLIKEIEEIQNEFSLEKAMGNDMLEDLTAYICRANDIETKCKEK